MSYTMMDNKSQSKNTQNNSKYTRIKNFKNSYDWSLLGCNKSSVNILKSYASLPINEFLALKSFSHLQLPRISIPLIADDVAWGVLSVDNFDIHKGGLLGHFVDEYDVSKWLQEIGKIAGLALYENREKKSLHDIELYIMKWKSNKVGLIQRVLQSCMDVLVGCKIMEIWGMSKSLDLKNVGYLGPSATSGPPGKHLIFSKIVIRPPKEFIEVVTSKQESVRKINLKSAFKNSDDNGVNDGSRGVHVVESREQRGALHKEISNKHINESAAIEVEA